MEIFVGGGGVFKTHYWIRGTVCMGASGPPNLVWGVGIGWVIPYTYFVMGRG